MLILGSLALCDVRQVADHADLAAIHDATPMHFDVKH
jgi:hypothetical protein